VRARATRRVASFAGGIVLCLSTAATDLVAAPNDAAPPAASPQAAAAAAGLADWRLQLVDKINRARTFPAGGYCREGLVKISFLIDRKGNLLSSEITESSNIPAFDVEALSMLKRAHPFPPPPDGIGGAFVTLNVPIRFRQESQGAVGEKRLYLNLKSDLTLTLDGVPVPSAGLDRTINATASNDKNVWIVICSDEKVPAEKLSELAEQVKTAGLKFTLVPRPNPASD
jgi:TonB family protein